MCPFLACTGLRLTTWHGGGRLWTFVKAAGKIGEGESQQRTQAKRTHALTLFAFCSSPSILCSLFLSARTALSSLIFFHLVTVTTCVYNVCEHVHAHYLAASFRQAPKISEGVYGLKKFVARGRKESNMLTTHNGYQ
ncbi:uncharacterized protein LOC122534725 [Frieseomelitta varia]|uniref:uncharacterized protein LOC122534725 n=1 Tax=Frieseomelitta varia TaxID=561572 RepID=UPI001CB6A55B|nr:uncharacterized protein LOC122534725 [Frieseomelitta varia]